MSSKVKEIIRYIYVLITIIFTFCFSVSCDSDVITSKNDRYAYTEVLLSNGTFSYKGRSYDFLSDVIKEVHASGTQEEPVRLTGNILSRPVSIPENLDVEIDLGGYQIKFFDVDDSAVKVSDSAKLHLENGTLLLNSKDKNLTVLNTKGADSRIHLKENVYIEGAVVVSDDAELLMSNNLSDIRMKNAHLVVEGAGMAVVTSVDGDTNTFTESPQATIVDKSGEIEPTDVEEGYWYITRGEVFHVYGSLKEAIESLEADDEVINLIDNEETGIPAEILLKQSITLNLNGYTTGTQNITLADNVDLEINGSGTFTGNISSEGEENSTLTVTGANLNSSVEISGDVFLKNVGGISKLPITSTNGSIVIDNSDADRNFGGGAITAKEDVVLKGYYHPISVGEVTAASLEATSVTEIGNVDVSGSLVSSGSKFAGTVNATTITDDNTEGAGSVFKGNITASEDISLTGSSFNSGTTTAPSVTSESGDINMNNVSGTAGAITANGADGSGNISVDNSASDAALKTGAITAANKADIKGKTGSLTVDIRENVYADEISIKNAHIYANGIAKSKSGNTYTPASSATIENPINASGPSSSYIGNLYAEDLTVSAPSVGVTLEVEKAFVSGDNAESTINGGYFGSFTYNGSGNLSVKGGNFTYTSTGYGRFTHSGTGSVTITGGTFADFVKKENSGACTVIGGSSVYVVGNHEQNNLETVNELIGFINADSANPVKIVYYPSGLIQLTGTIIDAGSSNGKAELVFNSYETADSKLIDGIIVANECELTFGANVTLSESDSSKIYVAKGYRLISNISLDGSDYKHIYKINTENNVVGKAIEADTTTIPGKYVYNNPMNYTVTFNANGGTASETSRTLNPGEPYGTLPTATKTGYDILGWYTEIEYGTEVTETMVPTEDITLYAHWEVLVIKPAVVGPHKAIVSNSKLYNSDGTILSEAETGIVPEPGDTNYKYYYVNTSDSDYTVYGKYNYNYHLIEITNSWSFTYRHSNLESALGLNVVKALAEANNKTELYFYESPTDTTNKVRYYKDGGEWKFENITNPGDIFSVEFDGTGQHF